MLCDYYEYGLGDNLTIQDKYFLDTISDKPLIINLRRRIIDTNKESDSDFISCWKPFLLEYQEVYMVQSDDFRS